MTPSRTHSHFLSRPTGFILGKIHLGWALGLLLTAGTALAQPKSDSTDEGIVVQVSGAQLQLASPAIQNLSRGEGLSMASHASAQLTQLLQSEGQLYDFIEQAAREERITEQEAKQARGKLQQREKKALQVLEKLYENLAPEYKKPVETWVEEHRKINESWLRTARKQEGQLPPWPPVVEPAAVDGEPKEDQTRVMVSNSGILIQRINDAGEKEIIFELGTVHPEAESSSPELDRLKRQRQRLEAQIDSIEGQDDSPSKDQSQEPDSPQNSEKDEEGDDEEDQSPSLLERLEQEAQRDEDNPQSKKLERTEGYFDLGFGFNQNLEEGQFLVEDVPGELNFWKSTVFNLGLGRKSRLGNPYSKFYLKYGIDFSWHNFHLVGSDVLNRGEEESFFGPIDPEQSYEKNKYHIAYFNIPLMLQLDFSEVGDRDQNFTLGLGAYGGIRMNSKRVLEYSTPVFERIESQVKDDFYTNQFRYGVMLELGYKHFKLRGHYDLNTFFRANRGPNYQLASLSLGFTW